MLLKSISSPSVSARGWKGAVRSVSEARGSPAAAYLSPRAAKWPCADWRNEAGGCVAGRMGVTSAKATRLLCKYLHAH